MQVDSYLMSPSRNTFEACDLRVFTGYSKLLGEFGEFDYPMILRCIGVPEKKVNEFFIITFCGW